MRKILFVLVILVALATPALAIHAPHAECCFDGDIGCCWDMIRELASGFNWD